MGLWRFLLSFCFLVAWIVTASADSVLVDGQRRDYLVWQPRVLTAPAPMIVVLHGGGGGARQMKRYSGLATAANAAGALAVFPEAIDGNWNDGRVGADGKELFASADVAFLDALIDQLIAEGKADSRRVFVAGISNGGMMALRMACDGKQRLAGIAMVAASYPFGLKCGRAYPLQILQFSGTDDPILPFGGGAIKSRTDRGAVQSAAAMLSYGLKRNNCASSSENSLPDAAPDDVTRVKLVTGQGCAARGAVMQYQVIGGGHTWPGSRSRFERLIGVTSQDTSATEVIVDRFLGPE
jgi:polyhydroxybutyrate depolymerase